MSFEKPSALANSIMAGLYDILTNGDDTVPKSEDHFFSWCTPGIPIQADDFDFLTQGLTGVVRKKALEEMSNGEEGPELTPELINQLRASDTARLYMQAESFSRLCDFVPDVATLGNDQYTQLSIMKNEGSLSDRYEYILRMSQVMKSELPAETKEKIERFRNLLTVTKIKKSLLDDSEVEVTEPSPLVLMYEEKRAAYEAAALEYNARRIKALAASNPEDVHYWSINANILRNRVKSAMSDWVSNGYKNDYESISAFIDQVMRRDMTLLKQQYRDDLQKAELTGSASGSDFYFTSLVPGNITRSTGWTEFSFKSADYNRYKNSSYASKYSASSGRGGLSFGSVLAGGGGKVEKSSQSYESKVSFDMEKFHISFSIAQAIISRPWFKTAFLTSQSWRFDQSNPEARSEMVSDGGNPAKGLIPAYPTSVLLIKDLKLTLGKNSGFSEFIADYEKTSTSGGGFLSLGPINLGGSHSKATTLGDRTANHHYTYDGETLTVPGMQAVGFNCVHMTEKSPNPLAEIKDWA